MAAPDVDRGVFSKRAKAYENVAEQIKLYISRRDRAVWASSLVHQGDRVGYYKRNDPPQIYPAIDTIRLKNSFDLFDLGHGYVGDDEYVLTDMFQAICFNATPHERRRLTRKIHQGRDFWGTRC